MYCFSHRMRSKAAGHGFLNRNWSKYYLFNYLLCFRQFQGTVVGGWVGDIDVSF